MKKSRAEKAKDFFLEGYNCSQAVILAFCDVVDIDKDILLSMASPFGGGIARLREVCGAFSSAIMILGYKFGYNTPEKGEKKIEYYKLIRDFSRRVEDANGSFVCRRLLGLGDGPSDPVPEERTKEYYDKRPCGDIIKTTAQILDDFIKEKEKNGTRI